MSASPDHCREQAHDTDAIAVQLTTATRFVRQCFSGTARQRARRVASAPLASIQAAALHDPDPVMRRRSLFFLDHFANDDSLKVFVQALGDPEESVRTMALHSLACET